MRSVTDRELHPANHYYHRCRSRPFSLLLSIAMDGRGSSPRINGKIFFPTRFKRSIDGGLQGNHYIEEAGFSIAIIIFNVQKEIVFFLWIYRYLISDHMVIQFGNFYPSTFLLLLLPLFRNIF